ncbi:hypothetical protein AJ79_02222 [Helicocarpus griseus UAMH5409]|uniref:Uncharacterized protein n=1 Tax=Helicocarpus griseus UAMH5409 TaxID=1447875 RepID=A0A2B7Y471_9EURO|nr:hypothetical protein AJ79_02222 [Helicocarpus griseus UAMH5409]
MESSPETLQQHQHQGAPPPQDLTLQVDFSWRQFKSLITNKNDPNSTPVYIVSYRPMKPHLVFKTTANSAKSTTTITAADTESQVDSKTVQFATGSLHTISINADCEIHGKKVGIRALRRFVTSYMHYSQAFAKTKTNSNSDGVDNDLSSNSERESMRMTWTSSSGWKTWDFICLDENQNPVAKFSGNIWGVKKVGDIIFLGENIAAITGSSTIPDTVRDEIVVTGLTLFYCMVLRVNSVFSLFGAVFSRPGHEEKKREKEKEAGKGKGETAA